MNLHNEYLAQVTISAYTSSNYNIPPELMKKFQEKVDSRLWGLRRDGEVIMVNLSETKCPEINFCLDLEDKETIEAFKKIPQWFKKEISLKEIPLRLKVIVYPDVGAEHLYWSESNDEDVWIIERNTWYIESVRNHFDIVRELDKDTDEIMRGLPDIKPYS